MIEAVRNGKEDVGHTGKRTFGFQDSTGYCIPFAAIWNGI